MKFKPGDRITYAKYWEYFNMINIGDTLAVLHSEDDYSYCFDYRGKVPLTIDMVDALFEFEHVFNSPLMKALS